MILFILLFIMPFYHHPRTFTPIRIKADKLAVKNGLRHAVFTSRFDKYVGEWKNNLKEGKGYFMTNGGKLYEGDWHEGFRCPDNVLGRLAKGVTKLNIREGYEEVKCKTSRHGFGKLSKKLSNGTYSLEYYGSWVRGKPEGAGWQYYENGDVYFGFWKKGYKHGYGKMWYADGTFYVGYWKLDKKNGLGMFVQENLNRYEGHWVDGLKDGRGRFYHLHTGQLQEGCWRQDVCVKSKMVDIGIRQFCTLPTPYPIPRENLISALHILELNEYWLKQEVGEIDKNLKHCI